MISQISSNIMAYQNQQTQSVKDADKKAKSQETKETAKVAGKFLTVSESKENGKVIGEPQLSEKATEYYNKLKEKFGNMDFILVSKDQKDAAKSQAGRFANPSKMVVLIDEEKIERMAEDEAYREKYEGIIANAASGISQLGSQIASTGANVKGFGMQIDDNGTAKYFAVLEKSSAAQKERIEKHLEEKKAEKKENAKKAEKAKEEKHKEEKIKEGKKSNTVTIEADSVEELLQKIQKISSEYLSDNVKTEEELQVGQKFDFSV